MYGVVIQRYCGGRHRFSRRPRGPPYEYLPRETNDATRRQMSSEPGHSSTSLASHVVDRGFQAVSRVLCILQLNAEGLSVSKRDIVASLYTSNITWTLGARCRGRTADWPCSVTHSIEQEELYLANHVFQLVNFDSGLICGYVIYLVADLVPR